MTKNNDLYHHGVKGMKWGVTRAKEIKKLGYVKDAIDSGSKAANEASKMTDRASKSTKASKKVKKELSQMSDKELRQKINRINMEREYADLNPSTISRGASSASRALSTIGSLASITASVTGAAVAIKQLIMFSKKK